MPPPCPVEVWRHDLEHHDVVAVGLAFALPQAVRGRAGERRQPAEALAELAAHLRIEFLAERSADVVIQRKQDLNELHDITSTATAAAACRPPARGSAARRHAPGFRQRVDRRAAWRRRPACRRLNTGARSATPRPGTA